MGQRHGLGPFRHSASCIGAETLYAAIAQGRPLAITAARVGPGVGSWHRRKPGAQIGDSFARAHAGGREHGIVFLFFLR